MQTQVESTEQIDWQAMWEQEHKRTKECTACGSLYDARALRCPCWQVKEADAELDAATTRADAAEAEVKQLRAALSEIADHDENSDDAVCAWCGGMPLPEGGVGYDHEDWCAVELARAVLAVETSNGQRDIR